MMEICWNVIAELTDTTVLGVDGFSLTPPRKKSRAILINTDSEIAVMYERESGLYALPGGGIEPGEDEVSAIIREIAEETGCVCDQIAPLGIISENRAHANTTHLSYFFVVHTKTKPTALHLTEEEIALGTVLKWYPLPEAVHRIQSNRADTIQKKFLQARDLAALEEYRRAAQTK